MLTGGAAQDEADARAAEADGIVLANAGVMDEFRERRDRTEQLGVRKDEEAGEVEQLRGALAEKKARRPGRRRCLWTACCDAAGAPDPAGWVCGTTASGERTALVSGSWRPDTCLGALPAKRTSGPREVF